MGDSQSIPASEQKKSISTVDTTLRRLREYVAALLAGVIVLTALVAIVLTFGLIDKQDTNRFTQAKDLLQMVLPLVTFILGYYFNKASTEARAESAEAVAITANEAAQKASIDRDRAVDQATTATAETAQVKEALQEVGSATEALLASEPEKTLGTMSDEDTGQVSPATQAARRDLASAWERAKRTMR